MVANQTRRALAALAILIAPALIGLGASTSVGAAIPPPPPGTLDPSFGDGGVVTALIETGRAGPR